MCDSVLLAQIREILLADLKAGTSGAQEMNGSQDQETFFDAEEGLEDGTEKAPSASSAGTGISTALGDSSSFSLGLAHYPDSKCSGWACDMHHTVMYRRCLSQSL